jgi:hypothetical protein
MMKRLLRMVLCGVLLNGAMPGGPVVRPAIAQTAQAQAYNAEQLDALLAPVALYPDALLAQVLMASTFPLQVVSAKRWLDDPAHKSLSGDALAKALAPQDWDPSVKSLVPFPSVVALLNSNLEWMQQLGYAFAEDQAGAMASVQRLRLQAQAAGNLKTTEQQVVRVEKQVVIIEPAQPTVVYVPNYNPTVVYGAWPYPAYPPVYLPPPPGYAFGTALVSGIAFATGVAVVGSLWGWARPGWGYGHVNVNVNHYNNINVNRRQINSATFQPNRPGGRPAGFQRPPNGPVGQPARRNGLPANAVGRPKVNVPASAVNRPPARAAGVQQPVNRSGGATANRSGSGQGVANRSGAPAQRRAPTRQPPAFSGIENGRLAAQSGARGTQSRTASTVAREARPAPRGGGGGGRLSR